MFAVENEVLDGELGDTYDAAVITPYRPALKDDPSSKRNINEMY